MARQALMNFAGSSYMDNLRVGNPIPYGQIQSFAATG
jgi:hypothetical protein